MSFPNIIGILIMLFLVSVLGYIFVIVKEKINLRNNMIIIDKKSVTQEHIDEAEVKEFILGGIEVKAGDEVKITLSPNKKVQGIVIGANKNANSIVLVTHEDEVKNFKVEKITKLKVISKYGHFFKIF